MKIMVLISLKLVTVFISGRKTWPKVFLLPFSSQLTLNGVVHLMHDSRYGVTVMELHTESNQFSLVKLGLL